MNAATLVSNPLCNRRVFSLLLSLVGVTAALVTTSCGGSSGTGQHLSGNTQVTLVVTGTANDQLQEFLLQIQSLTLTDKAGKMVSLVSSPQSVEFIHINGGIEPLLTVTVPQDVYTSATAVIGNAEFNCETMDSYGGVDFSTFEYGYTPQQNVTVNVPGPLTVSGDNMGLLLNLEVAQSASFSACFDPNNSYTWSITPTFNLTPITLSAQPTNAGNGLVTALNGQIASIDAGAGSFVVALPKLENSRTISVSTSGSTVFQGIGNFSSLAIGTFVNLDGAIQPDSSVAATRVAAVDTAATSLVTGPLVSVNAAEPALASVWRQQQGALFSNGWVLGGSYLSFGSAAFLTSGEFSNLQSLPFTASFNGSNMVAGQNAYFSTSSTENSGGFPYIPLTTAMLIPQTLNGTISGVSSSGNFTIYTVTLADYDLFPTFAVQQGQTTLLSNPSQIEVYVDSSTQMLNTSPLAAGSLARFYGLVFNDNGTLRVDCAQVNDGVELNPPMTPSASSTVKGRSAVVRTVNTGDLHYTVRLITPSR
jgi:Domain of unknown function (DUF5666)